MFGISAYAQATYAGLGGSYFVVTLTENIAVLDTAAVAATFVTFITEQLAAADINVGTAYYQNITISEGIAAGDINQVLATFVKSATENINLLDAPLGFAWVKIDNTEGTTWTLIDNRQ